MIWTLLLALGCRCSTEKPPPRIDAPTVDRTAVRGATCYRNDDGVLLELVLSASTDATGVLTRAGEDPLPLEGRRTGRLLDFGSVQVELLGRSVALTEGSKTSMLEAGGCP